LHEVSVCVLNETHNVDLTTKRGNRDQRAEKEKEPLNQNGKEIKPNYYKIQNKHAETLKEELKYLNGRYVPLWGHFKIFF
jgi:hypothetical protein